MIRQKTSLPTLKEINPKTKAITISPTVAASFGVRSKDAINRSDRNPRTPTLVIAVTPAIIILIIGGDDHGSRRRVKPKRA